MSASPPLTLRQIAALSRTSKSTVSRVLTGQRDVSPATRRRIERVMKKHGYQPNLYARGLAGGRTGLVGVILRWIESGFFAEVIRGVDHVVGEHGGHLMTSVAHSTEDYFRLIESFSRERRVDGIVLVAPPLPVFRHSLPKSDTPVVLCACRPGARTSGWERANSVVLDNRQALTDLLTHLVERGCRDLVHVAGPKDSYDALERLEAFTTFIKDRPHVSGSILQGGFSMDDGFKSVLGYLRLSGNRLPDAFVGFNDSTAYGILKALEEVRPRGWEEVAITGCDDERAASLLGITTIQMNMVEVGRACARALYAQLESPDAERQPSHAVMKMSLVIRATTGGGPHLVLHHGTRPNGTSYSI